MTSKDLNWPQKDSSPIIEAIKPKKNKFKGGVKSEFNDEYFVEIHHNNALLIDLATQVIYNDQIVRINTVQDSKEFNSQSLAT